MENGKKPAFQTSIGMSNSEMENMGLTKREYFAAMAMQGYVVQRYAQNDTDRANIIKWSVKMADALLKALETKSE